MRRYTCPRHGLDMPYDLARNWYRCPKHSECSNSVAVELEFLIGDAMARNILGPGAEVAGDV